MTCIKHSMEPWLWHDGGYTESCTIYGCPHKESSADLDNAGLEDVEETTKHNHTWSPWKHTGDGLGTYEPPFKYVKMCSCGAKYWAEDLIKIKSKE